MANFPSSLPAAGSASPSATLAAAGHTSLHNVGADESRALAAKVGLTASTPAANTFLGGDSAGNSSWQQVDLSTGDVTGTLPLTKGGTGQTSLASLADAIGEILYPVGSIYVNATDSTNPATLLGFGTWVAFGQGRVMAGLNASDTDFDSAEEVGGAKTHTLTTAEMPAHTHAGFNFQDTAGGASITHPAKVGTTTNPAIETDASTGGGGAHNNLQPYIVVYMFKRTA